MRVADANLEPKGYQQLTVSSTAVGLTVPAGSKYALLKLNDANLLRWRDDGTDPTASVGMPLPDQADEFFYTGKLARIKFIRSGGTDAVLNCSYYA